MATELKSPELGEIHAVNNTIAEICALNGINVDDLPGAFTQTKSLRLLFQITSLDIQLNHFTGLTELILISQNLTTVPLLGCCEKLKKLWICECGIQRIQNMQEFRALEELNLYGNLIHEIENLDFLGKLRILNLNNNFIRSIAGLSKLKNLEIVELSNNEISTVGCNLRSNLSLYSLSISGNLLHHFFDIISLSTLPKLTRLSINEPGARKNPVCMHRNLPLVIMQYLPKLEYLDNVCLQDKQLRRAARIAVRSKLSYYTMRLQHLKSKEEQQIGTLSTTFMHISTRIYTQIKMLDEMQRKIEIGTEVHTIGGNQSEDSIKHLRVLRQHIEHWERQINRYRFELASSKLVFKHRSDVRRMLYQIEFEQGGYLKIDEGCPDDQWVKNISNLIVRKMCSHKLGYGEITGIKIVRAYKINHKLTLNTTESTERTLYQNNGTTRGNTYSFVARTGDSQSELSMYRQLISMQISCGVELKNSIEEADEKNLDIFKSRLTGIANWIPEQFATFLIVRVPEDTTIENQYDKLHYPKRQFGPKQQAHCEQNDIFCENDVYSDLHSHLVPEYLIELHYVIKDGIISPFYQTMIDGTPETAQPNLSKQIDSDSALMKSITKELFNGRCDNSTKRLNSGEPNFGATQGDQVNYFGLKGLHAYNSLFLTEKKNIVHLCLTHCQLHCLPDMSNLPLKTLDICHNNLNTLKSLCELPVLIILNINYNLFTCLPDILSEIAHKCISLQHVKLRYNPWDIDDSIRAYTSAILENVQKVDDNQLSKDEVTAAKIIRTTLQNHTLKYLIKHGRVNVNLQRMTLYSNAEYLSLKTPGISKRIEPTYWRDMVSLCVKNCYQNHMCSFENMLNLRYLCLDDNYLTNLDFLSDIYNLEELSAESNFLTNIRGIENHKKLRRLFLSKNQIRCMNMFEQNSFPEMEILMLGSNKLRRLSDIELCEKLRELYASNNHISDFKTIVRLRKLIHLEILELFGNPVTRNVKNYKLRTLYHLQQLRGFEGQMITTHEVMQARELFGGHLSYESLVDEFQTEDCSTLEMFNLSGANIKVIEPLEPSHFQQLSIVNLENNQLTTFGGLLCLKQLKILCLNDNYIDKLFPSIVSGAVDYMWSDDHMINLFHSDEPIFPSLQVLLLGRNRIRTMRILQLYRMPQLQSLFLQHNEITNFDGLEDTDQLKELVLDGNKIRECKTLQKFERTNIQELHMENNRLRSLQGLEAFSSLRKVFLSGNKLSDLNELEEYIKSQKELQEVTITENPLVSKQLHRFIIIRGSIFIQIIDGIPITDEERQRCAEFYAEIELQTVLETSTFDEVGCIRRPLTKNTEKSLPDMRTRKPTYKLRDIIHTRRRTVPRVYCLDNIERLTDSGSDRVQTHNVSYNKQQSSPTIVEHELSITGVGVRMGSTTQLKPDTTNNSTKQRATELKIPGLTIYAIEK